MTIKIKDSFRWIAFTTLIVGTLDAVAAIVVYQADPFRLFQFISSGALGRETAFGGGVGSFLLGVFFHYFIAACWTTLFVLLYDKIQWIRFNKLVAGLVYGLVIWVVMNMIVLKLSRIDAATPPIKQIVIGATILVFAVGLPIALLSGRLDRSRRPSRAKA
ncbi:MAG TPA: hypothetical protein VGD40_09165 [Chryseosolibacter sp.]